MASILNYLKIKNCTSVNLDEYKIIKHKIKKIGDYHLLSNNSFITYGNSSAYVYKLDFKSFKKFSYNLYLKCLIYHDDKISGFEIYNSKFGDFTEYNFSDSDEEIETEQTGVLFYPYPSLLAQNDNFIYGVSKKDKIWLEINTMDGYDDDDNLIELKDMKSVHSLSCSNKYLVISNNDKLCLYKINGTKHKKHLIINFDKESLCASRIHNDKIYTLIKTKTNKYLCIYRYKNNKKIFLIHNILVDKNVTDNILINNEMILLLTEDGVIYTFIL